MLYFLNRKFNSFLLKYIYTNLSFVYDFSYIFNVKIKDKINTISFLIIKIYKLHDYIIKSVVINCT